MTLIVETKNETSAKLLAEMLRHFDFVKTVNRKPSKKLKPLTAEDWIKPGRPATDEEIDQLIEEMEADETEGNFLSLKEAKAKTLKSLAQWRKKNLK